MKITKEDYEKLPDFAKALYVASGDGYVLASAQREAEMATELAKEKAAREEAETALAKSKTPDLEPDSKPAGESELEARLMARIQPIIDSHKEEAEKARRALADERLGTRLNAEFSKHGIPDSPILRKALTQEAKDRGLSVSVDGSFSFTRDKLPVLASDGKSLLTVESWLTDFKNNDPILRGMPTGSGSTGNTESSSNGVNPLLGSAPNWSEFSKKTQANKTLGDQWLTEAGYDPSTLEKKAEAK